MEPSEPSTPVEPSEPPSTSPSTPDIKPDEKPTGEPEEKLAPQLPASADEDRPDLSVQVLQDKPEFEPGEDIGLEIVVTNKGRTTAPNVRFGHVVQIAWLAKGADELSSRPSIGPGQSKRFRVVLRPTSPSSSAVSFQFRATVDGVGDPTPGDNGTDLSIKVRRLQGTVTGVVYVDKNANGAFDEGEGLANTWIDTRGGTPYGSRSGLTDANGAFKMWSVPAGNHKVWGIGWDSKYVPQPGFVDFVVKADQETRIMVPPVRTSLSASLAFDKESYAPSDPVGVDITLSNSGTQPITGVVAVCQSYSAENLTSKNWGVLSPTGAGNVEFAAGANFTFHVTTSASPDYGYVTVSCSFGPTGNFGNPWLSATAKVPGAKQTFTGFVVSGDFMEGPKPVPNAKLVLLDPQTGAPVVSTTTNAEGAWTFPDLPVGEYKPLVVGPWKVVEFGEGEPFGNVRGREYPTYVWVQPGPDVADPTVVPATPGGAGGADLHISFTPAAAAKNPDALANTGVSVLGIAPSWRARR